MAIPWCIFTSIHIYIQKLYIIHMGYNLWGKIMTMISNHLWRSTVHQAHSQSLIELAHGNLSTTLRSMIIIPLLLFEVMETQKGWVTCLKSQLVSERLRAQSQPCVPRIHSLNYFAAVELKFCKIITCKLKWWQRE